MLYEFVSAIGGDVIFLDYLMWGVSHTLQDLSGAFGGAWDILFQMFRAITY